MRSKFEGGSIGLATAVLITGGEPQGCGGEADDMRARVARCEAAVPAPLEGDVFDPERLNVAIAEDDEETLLPHDPECQDEPAWHYDDEAPEKVVLCPETCAEYGPSLHGGTAQMRFIFGCHPLPVTPNR